jgi:hypothetical protein
MKPEKKTSRMETKKNRLPEEKKAEPKRLSRILKKRTYCERIRGLKRRGTMLYKDMRNYWLKIQTKTVNLFLLVLQRNSIRIFLLIERCRL